MIAKPIQVKAIGQYSIWIQFSDNTEGHVDLSYLVSKPIFAEWNNPDFFKTVHVDAETDAIVWNEDIELCPDSLYFKVKGL